MQKIKKTSVVLRNTRPDRIKFFISFVLLFTICVFAGIPQNADGPPKQGSGLSDQAKQDSSKTHAGSGTTQGHIDPANLNVRNETPSLPVISFLPCPIAIPPDTVPAGQRFTAEIQIHAIDRNGGRLPVLKDARSFSAVLAFDQTELTFVNARAGSAVSGLDWEIQKSSLEPGKVKIVLLAGDTSSSFTGTGQILQIEFQTQPEQFGQAIFSLTGYRFTPMEGGAFGYNGLFINSKGQSIPVSTDSLPPHIGISGFVQTIPEKAAILEANAATDLVVVYFPANITRTARWRESRLEIIRNDGVLTEIITYDLENITRVLLPIDRHINQGDSLCVRYAIQGTDSWDNPIVTSPCLAETNPAKPLDFRDYQPFEIRDIHLIIDGQQTNELTLYTPPELHVTTNAKGPVAIEATLETMDGRRLVTLVPMRFYREGPPKLQIPEMIQKGKYNLIVTAEFLFDLSRTTIAEKRIPVVVK